VDGPALRRVVDPARVGPSSEIASDPGRPDRSIVPDSVDSLPIARPLPLAASA